MNPKSKASQTYLRSAVFTASPEQLQLMLYDGAIKYAQQGQAALAARDFEAAFNALDRAQRIVLQIHAGLKRDTNPEYVDRVGAICDFIYRRLIDGNAFQNTQAIDQALDLLRQERETWLLVMDKVAAAQAAGGQKPAPQSPPAPAAQKLPVAANLSGRAAAFNSPAPTDKPTSDAPVLSLEG